MADAAAYLLERMGRAEEALALLLEELAARIAAMERCATAGCHVASVRAATGVRLGHVASVRAAAWARLGHVASVRAAAWARLGQLG